MYGLPDSLQKLSTAEESVLLAVWRARAPITASEIARCLPQQSWAQPTIVNFLYRLVAKGWLRCTKEGGKNVYTPLVTRRAYGVYTMRERLETVFEGSHSAAFAAILSETTPTVATLEAVKQEIDAKIASLEEWEWYDSY